MFKHLLLPTDGSGTSEAAVRKGLQFAKEQQARVTAVHVVPEFHTLTYRTTMLEDTREEFIAECKAQAQKFLSEVERAAKEEGVACRTVMITHDHPHEAINDTAAQSGCDLIVMASHGRRGIKGLLLGSETQKVLTHATLPVLVLR
ncbi:universal stress protein [Methylibium sp.]|uniref:universal stress protein n=1 Tax=Methylibium sp. TaxID=2067992 RepID=UPI003D0B04A8